MINVLKIFVFICCVRPRFRSSASSSSVLSRQYYLHRSLAMQLFTTIFVSVWIKIFPLASSFVRFSVVPSLPKEEDQVTSHYNQGRIKLFGAPRQWKHFRPLFQAVFLSGGVYYPPDWVKHHASQSQDRNNKYFILYIEFCINNI